MLMTDIETKTSNICPRCGRAFPTQRSLVVHRGWCGKGRVNGRKGKHHSVEAREKISRALQGENSPNYGKHHRALELAAADNDMLAEDYIQQAQAEAKEDCDE